MENPSKFVRMVRREFIVAIPGEIPQLAFYPEEDL